MCVFFYDTETKLQNVLVPLENCPKNVIKNSIIRIYSPWSTIESKTLGLLMYVGVVHVEIIECPGPTRPLGPFQPFTNLSGLLTSVYQSKVLWKCKCSKGIISYFTIIITFQSVNAVKLIYYEFMTIGVCKRILVSTL